MKKNFFAVTERMKVAIIFSLFLFSCFSLQAQPVISIDNALTSFADRTLQQGSTFARTFTVRNTGNSAFSGQIRFQDNFNSGLKVNSITLTHNISSPGTIAWDATSNSNPLIDPLTGVENILNVSGLGINQFITFTESVTVSGCVDNNNGRSIIRIQYCNTDGTGCKLASGSTNADGVTSRLNQNITRPDPSVWSFINLTTEGYENCTYPVDGSTTGPGVRHKIYKLGKSSNETLRDVKIRYVSGGDNTSRSFNSIRFSRELTPGGTRVPVTPRQVDWVSTRTGVCIDDDFADMQINVGDLSNNEAFIIEFDEYNCCPSDGEFRSQFMKGGLFYFNASSDCNVNVYSIGYPEPYNHHDLVYNSYYLQRPTQLFGPHASNGNIPDLGNCVMPVDMTTNTLAFWGNNGDTGYDFSMENGQIMVVLNYDYGLTYTGYDQGTLAAFPFSNYDFVNDPRNENAFSNMYFRLETNPAVTWNPVNVQGTVVPAIPGYKEARAFTFDIGSFDWVGLGQSSYDKAGLYLFLNSSELVYSLEPLCENAPAKSRYTVQIYWIPDAVTCPTVCRLPVFSLEKDCAVMCPGCLFPGGAGDFSVMERVTMGLKDDNNNSLPDDGTPADPSINNNDNDPLNDIRTNFGIIGDEVRLHTQYYLTGGGNTCGDGSTVTVGPDDDDFGPLRFSYLRIDFPYGNYFGVKNGKDMTVNIYDHRPAAGDAPIATFLIPNASIPDLLSVYPGAGKDATYYFDFSLDNLQPYLVSGTIPSRYRSFYRIEFDLRLEITTNEEYGDRFQEVFTSLFPYFSATADNAGSPPYPALPQIECEHTSGTFSNWAEYPTHNGLFNSNTKFLCEGFFGSFNLVGVYRTTRQWNVQNNEYNGQSDNGCGKYSEFVSTVTIGKDIQNLFVNEFRPAFPVTSYEFPVPDGYVPLNFAVYSSFARRNPGSSAYIEQGSYKRFTSSQVGSPISASNGYKMYNVSFNYQPLNETTNWQGLREGDLILGDESTSYIYQYRILYQCKSITASQVAMLPDKDQIPDNKIKIHYNTYPGTNGSSFQISDSYYGYNAATPRNELELRNPGGTGNTISVFSETFTEDFVIKALEDGSHYAAMHPFLTIEPQVAGEFVNLQITDNTHASAIKYIGTFGNKQLYTIDMTPYRGTSLLGRERLRVLEEYVFSLSGSLVCNNADPNHNYGIKLGYGWACNNYPATITDVNNACFYKEETINVVPVVTGWLADFTADNSQCDKLNFTHVTTSNGGQITDPVYSIDLAPGLTLATMYVGYGSQILVQDTEYSISPAIGASNPSGQYTVTIFNDALTLPFMADLFGAANTNTITIGFTTNVSTVCNQYSTTVPTVVNLNGISFCDRTMPVLSSTSNPSNNSCIQYSALISGNTTVCPGNVSLVGAVNGGAAPYTFRWYDVNNLSSPLFTQNNVTSSTFPAILNTTSTIRLIVTDANGCQTSDDHAVNVRVVQPGTIGGLAPSYCKSSVPVTMTGSPTGGVFSGHNVSGNTFVPMQVGLNTITYNYTDANGCAGIATQVVMVYELPVVTISGLANSYCENGNPVSITGSPAGGTFTGSNLSGSTLFTPSPAGTYVIRYTYSDGNGCTNFDEEIVRVTSKPIVTISGNATVCRKTSQTLTATVSGTPSYTYQWFADGAIISGATAASYTYTASTLGTKTYKVVVSDANQCEGEDDFVVVTEECCTYKIGDVTQTCNSNNSLICVPLIATVPVDPGIIGMDFCLKYDPAILSPVTGKVDYLLGPVVNHSSIQTPSLGKADIAINTSIPGEIHVSIFYMTNQPVGTFFQGQGNVICIPLIVKGGVAAGTAYTFTACELEEAYTLTEKSGCWTPGSLTVVPSTVLNGKLILWGDVTKTLGMNYVVFNNATNALTDITTVNADCSNRPGSPLVRPQGSNNPSLDGNFTIPFVTGDKLKIERDIKWTPTNPLQYINGADTYRISRITTLTATPPVPITCNGNSNLKANTLSYSLCPPSAYEMIAADVNMNGKVRANDITLIQQRIVKRIDQYPQVWNDGLIPAKPSLDWRYIDKYTVDNNPEFKISPVYPNPDPNGVGFWRDKVPTVPLCLPIRSQCAGSQREYYSGILLGDLVASNTSQYYQNSSIYMKKGNEYQVVFNVHKTTNLPQDYYRVYVEHEIPEEDTLVAIDFSMDYNESALSVVDLKQTNASIENEVNMMWNDFENKELILTSYSDKFLPHAEKFYYFDIHRPGGMPKEQDFGTILALLNGEEVNYRINISTDIIDGVDDATSVKPYLNVTPNPGMDQSVIEYRRNSDVNSRIVMYNTLGQVVREFTNLEIKGERDLQLEELASGSYVIIMYCGEEKYSKQFLIQK